MTNPAIPGVVAAASRVLPAMTSPDEGSRMHQPNPESNSGPNDVPDYFPDELPAFSAGQLVRHRRYGYRGVVVDFDVRCQAPDAWYHHNKTQPDRDQPWYHVLVHGSAGQTYAAQTSLMLDATDEPIDHPLIDDFFENFRDGRYVRNDEPWPGWE